MLDGIDPSGWIADKGYVGMGMIIPYKKPPTANRARPRRRPIGASAGFAGPEERTIARIKSWRIHPHRLPAPPALK